MLSKPNMYHLFIAQFMDTHVYSVYLKKFVVILQVVQLCGHDVLLYYEEPFFPW